MCRSTYQPWCWHAAGRPGHVSCSQPASPDDTALAGRRRESWRATYVRARARSNHQTPSPARERGNLLIDRAAAACRKPINQRTLLGELHVRSKSGVKPRLWHDPRPVVRLPAEPDQPVAGRPVNAAGPSAQRTDTCVLRLSLTTIENNNARRMGMALPAF
jgi:hypothetical protein